MKSNHEIVGSAARFGLLFLGVMSYVHCGSKKVGKSNLIIDMIRFPLSPQWCLKVGSAGLVAQPLVAGSVLATQPAPWLPQGVIMVADTRIWNGTKKPEKTGA